MLGCFFTCLNIRTVHIVVKPICFVASNGQQRTIISDNAGALVEFK